MRLPFALMFVYSCGVDQSTVKLWKHNPYNNRCTEVWIESYYNNRPKFPHQYPQTNCYTIYWPDYEDYYYYCNDKNGEKWYYFKYLQDCLDNGGIAQ